MNIAQYATHDVVSLEPDSSIDKAIAYMEEFHVHHLPVVRDDEVVGMVSDRDVLLAVGWKLSSQRRVLDEAEVEMLGPGRVEQIMSTPVVTMSPSDQPADAGRAMLRLRINAIPLVRAGRLAGILTEADLLRHARESSAANVNTADAFRRPVWEFMTARVAAVTPRATVFDVVDVLRHRRSRHVPVAVDNTLLGIISDRDVRRALAEARLAEQETQQVGEFCVATPCAMDMMTRLTRTTAPTAPLGDALNVMLDECIHCLPVVLNDRLVGIITHTDVLRALLSWELL